LLFAPTQTLPHKWGGLLKRLLCKRFTPFPLMGKGLGIGAKGAE